MIARRQEYSICLARHNSDASRARSPNAGCRCSSIWNGSISVPYTSNARAESDGLVFMDDPRDASIAAIDAAGKRELFPLASGIQMFRSRIRPGQKSLPHAGGLLLALPRRCKTNRTRGSRDQLEAQWIRINAKGMSGFSARMQLHCKRRAGGIGAPRHASFVYAPFDSVYNLALC